MRHVPRQNISPRITDIKKPASASGSPSAAERVGQPFNAEGIAEILTPAANAGKSFPPIKIKSPRSRGAFLVLLVGVIIGGTILFTAYRYQSGILNSAVLGLERIQSAAGDLNFFNPGEAQEKISASRDLSKFSPSGTSLLSQNFSLSRFWTVLKESGKTFRNFQALLSRTLLLTAALSDLKNNAPTLLLSQEGDRFIAALEEIRKILAQIQGTNTQLASLSLKLKDVAPADFSGYLPFELDIARAEEFLDAFIPWLSSPTPRHLLLFFHNTSVMRPGGGLIESYADLVIQKGKVERIEVHEVSEADRALRLDVVPPAPLQALISRWRAADANWFFDYPESAAATLSFLEASEMYEKASTTFDGVIGISPRVVSGLLGLSGPLEISDLGLTLEQNNFLVDIERKIEREKQKGGETRKEILQKFGARLLEELSRLSYATEEKDYRLMEEWLAKKDLLFYFKDPALQGFFDYHGWSGRLTALSPDLSGDYFAVALANIGGGKTDLFINNRVTFQSHIDSSGNVSNRVVIAREHRGGESRDSWHRVPNQSYLTIFTPRAVKVTNVSGGFEMDVVPPLDYDAKGYGRNKLLAAIESTRRDYLNYPTLESFEESGKNVFGFWSKMTRGETARVAIDYARKLPAAPYDGQSYRFIFEKQPGSRGIYKFEINAPLGFVWRETGAPLFEYETDDPEGKLIFDLTLARL